YPRSSLVDHFLSPSTKLEDFASNSHRELGDFIAQSYEGLVKKKSGKVVVSLCRVGVVDSEDGVATFEVRKQIHLVEGQEKLEVHYQLKNLGGQPVQVAFGSEWNFNLLGGGHNEQAYYKMPVITLDDEHLDSWGELEGLKKIALGNRHLGIELEMTASPAITLWRFPVESVSNSEGGIERIYQSSCLLLLLPISLAAGEGVSLDLIWTVRTAPTTR
ncbi:MAG: DUF1926 domain-containing protein, partial [Chloroflexi bacterium]|nr:DUF1926 domain-containing protein [Chloroflexota bacterium]